MMQPRRYSLIQILLVAILLGIAIFAWFYLIDTVTTSPTVSSEQSETEATLTPVLTVTPEVIPSIIIDTPTKVSLPSPTPTSTITPTPSPIIHIVQSGEVLSEIALEYGTTVEEILTTNDLTDPSRLQIGQELIMPVTVIPTPTLEITSTPTPAPTVYVVQSGDTLLGIAAVYNTTADALMLANDIDDAKFLRAGQELIIVLPDEEIVVPDSDEIVVTFHEIFSGDTLSGLAQRYGSTVNEILAANPGLSPDALRVGQEIAIPVSQASATSATPISVAPSEPRIVDPEPSSESLFAVEQEVFEAANAQRLLANRAAYTFDEALADIARAHAQDMVARDYFDHYTPEGIGVRARTEAKGLQLNWVGENIQRNTESIDQTAQTAIGWFMGSTAHRDNLLNERFNRVGVGVAEGPPGWYTIVMVFAGD